MKEDMEQNQDVWERLFPDPERLGLAQTFIEKVADVDGIEKVVSLKSKPSGTEMLHVLVKERDDDSTTLDEQTLLSVYRIHREVCTDRRLSELLGDPRPLTEAEFTMVKYPDLVYEKSAKFLS